MTLLQGELVDEDDSPTDGRGGPEVPGGPDASGGHADDDGARGRAAS
jgi:hypothetical protein